MALSEIAANAATAAMFRTVEFYFGRSLPPDARPWFRQTVADIKHGAQKLPAEAVHHLQLEIDHNAHEVLAPLQDRPIILVGNYIGELPLLRKAQMLTWGREGVVPLLNLGPAIATSHAVKETTGKEVRWIQVVGVDKKATRLKALSQRVVEPVHAALAHASNNLIVGDSGIKGVNAIKAEVVAGGIPGLYLEGKPGHKLRRADERSGKLLLLLSSIPDLAIVCVTSQFKNDKFQLTFNTPAIDVKALKQWKREYGAAAGQILGDYLMSIIAKNIEDPKERGYYQQLVEIPVFPG